MHIRLTLPLLLLAACAGSETPEVHIDVQIQDEEPATIPKDAPLAVPADAVDDAGHIDTDLPTPTPAPAAKRKAPVKTTSGTGGRRTSREAEAEPEDGRRTER